MAYVIAEPCVGTCDAACVSVCPVDCIHGPLAPEALKALSIDERGAAKLQLYIDPETCTSCGACETECPVSAIFDEDDLPEAWAHYRQLNATFFERR
jgi:NAD-dependent dihydropyrimidine dehydrogenase PreA subunit